MIKQTIAIAIGIFIALWLYGQYQAWQARQQARQVIEDLQKWSADLTAESEKRAAERRRQSPPPRKATSKRPEY